MVFIETPAFTRQVPSYLTDDEYRRLQQALLVNPEAGTVMPGTGGFRKMRWRDPRRSKGTRGGLRVVYYHFPNEGQIWLMTLYDKDELKDLTAAEKRVLRTAINVECEARAAQRPTARGDKAMGREKRTLFGELMDGVAAMAAHREGKLTLRTHQLELRPLPRVTTALVRDTRMRLNMSQGVFARKLRVNPRTLERWEQGRSRPNDQAATLILLVRRFPDTVDRLDVIGTSRRSRRAA